MNAPFPPDSADAPRATNASEPLFPLGRVVSTPAALAACSAHQLLAHLQRHAHGDWGLLDSEDRAVNDHSAVSGGRLLSAYAIDPALPCQGTGDNCVWVITEGDRSVTTFLLPDEY